MRAAAVVLAVVVLGAGGCERIARNMYDDARERPMRGEPDVQVAEGIVPASRGVLAAAASGRPREDTVAVDAKWDSAQRLPESPPAAMLARGRERYDIYCSPCHSSAGDGDGMVARRGFPHPPSYRIDRLRQAPDRHFYDVITQGHGVMASYGDRVAPADRWAIVAHIRSLQRGPAQP